MAISGSFLSNYHCNEVAGIMGGSDFKGSSLLL